MTTYYARGDTAFNNNVGTATGTCYNGPGGIYNAITGLGNATKLAAGDQLLVYTPTPVNLTRLFEVLLGKDVGTAGWAIGDAVQDNNGGAEWQGVLTNVTTTTVMVELAVGQDFSDVTQGNGINNTTQTDKIGRASCRERVLS